MKKILLPLFVLLFLITNAAPVFAIAKGQPCTGTVDNNECDDPYACINGTCQVDPNLDPAQGTGVLGVVQGAQQVGQGVTQVTAAAANDPCGPNSTSFCSLTKIPLFDQAGNAGSLAAFLNAVYKICIGLAAVLAVLQLMRAGIMYMGGDSVTEKSAARNLIAQSLFGLLLVLSPVIVFGIINPKILSLQIGGLDSLGAGSSAAPSTAGAGSAPGAGAGASSAAPSCTHSTYVVDDYQPLSSGQTCAAKYSDSTSVTVEVACCDSSATPEAGYVCCAHPPQ